MEVGEAVGEVPEGVEALQTTTNSKKVCTGGSVPNIQLECRKRIDDWTGGNVEADWHPMPGQWGAMRPRRFLDDPMKLDLEINRTGRALLKCQFQPS